MKRNQEKTKSSQAKKLLALSMVATSVVGIGAFAADTVEAAEQYYYDKYNSIGGAWLEPSIAYTQHVGMHGSLFTDLYKKAVWNPSNKNWDLSERWGTPYMSTGAVGYSMRGNELLIITVTRGNEYNNLEGSVRQDGKYSTDAIPGSYSRGSLVQSSIIADNATYPANGRHADGFWYVRGAALNTAPSTPTINVPTAQFEHGDKQTISWSASTDAEGNPITYQLEASYNGNGTWETLTTTANRYFDFTVPSNKTSVIFRVRATDSKLYSAYSTGTSKSIQPVQYYWNKFGVTPIYNSTFVWNEDSAYTITLANQPGYWYGYYSGYTTDSSGKVTGQGSMVPREQMSRGSTYYYISFGTLEHKVLILDTGLNITGSIVRGESTTAFSHYSKGALIQNDIKAGINAFQHGTRNPDGFWYERGQRVALPDTTPPIIELTEQENYAPTSTVDVKVHDLSAIKTVKYAKGNHDVSYFSSNGTTITTSFTATENGEYTLFAEDAHGNKAVEVYTVTKVNAVPVITTADTDFVTYTVLDDTNGFLVKGASNDTDGHDVTVTVDHQGIEKTGIVQDGAFEVQMNGSDYENGFYTTNLVVTPNDGYEDGKAKSIEGKTIIRVDDAASYLADLVGHDESNEDWTKAQHEAFYRAYESIFTYETERTAPTLADAQAKIDTLKSSTSIAESNTLTEWQNRLDLVTATVATKTAEGSLEKVDFENALALVEGLVPSPDKDLLVPRVAELTRYHTAKDALITMENDPSIVSWPKINEAQDFIDVVENKTNKSALQKQLTNIIKKFMSNLTTVTPEDLENFDAENVNPDLGGMYDEYLDAFQPLGEGSHAQDLVDFVNALKVALQDLTPSAVNALHAKVPGYAEAALQPVTKAVDSLLEYRQSFLREATKDANLAALVKAVSYGLTSDYMDTMTSAMQEVIEYNVTHDEGEKAEGVTSIIPLWEGQLKVDMQAYLDNGIPEIIILEDSYEYINDGSLTVVGSIQDSNDSTHDIEVTFGGVTKTTTANGSFSVTFDGLAEGVHESDITILAKDLLTTKSYTITNKPVITVSDVELFKQFGQALSNDLGQIFDEIDSAVITSLKTIFDDTTNVSIDSPDRKIRDIENAAQTLSNLEEGELETLVKSIFFKIRLDWLINNYSTATVEDFAWAGVVGVNPGNIADLVSIIDDYVSQFTDGNVVTPGLNDYHDWLKIQATMNQARTDIETAENIFTTKELSEAIANAETTLATIPDWITAKTDLRDRLDAVTNYYDALITVETAETTYGQSDKDSAQLAVEALPDSAEKEDLQTRLDIVQMVIDAIVAVELAESTLDEADQLVAQDLVDVLPDEHPMKSELQNRLDSISNINLAIAAVVQAETTYTKADKDVAQELVDALADGPKKAELESRLNEVQKVLDAAEAVAQAESSLVLEDILNAQEKVDAIADDNPKKAELQNMLDAIEGLRATIEAVDRAESTNKQSDKDAAQNLVDVLPDGEGKNTLQNRLDEVQTVIDAIQAIEVAEATLTDTDQETAQSLVDAIADGNPIKQELQDRLDSISQLKDAMTAVDQAESTFEQLDKDTAQDLVDALPASPEKDALNDRLNELQKVLDKLFGEENATNAVEKAENTFSQTDKDAAQELVDALEEGPVKDELINRLDDLQAVLDSIIEIESVVAKAEASKLQEDVDTAQDLLDGLAESDIKSALQDRLDEVNRYIKAEKAVTNAEENHFQRVKDAAQALVDALQEDAAKQGLQDRLDALQLILDGKVKDLLDEIINNPNDVTPGDLADYTDETVYEELMPDYIDEMGEIGETITKDQVIEVVRLINKLEIAKRSMLNSDIQAYEKELSQTTLPTKSNYPQPALLSAISEYVNNDNELENVISHMAAELNCSVEEIREEIKAILDGSLATGFYVVKYQLETGEVIETKTVEKIAYGPIEVLANVPKGYVLVGEDIYSFELTEENKGYEVIFTVKEDVAEAGEYTVKYQLEDGTVVSESTLTAPYGELTVTAEVPEGFTLADDTKALQNVVFEKDNALEIIFEVKEVEKVITGSYLVQYVLEDLSVIEEATFTSNYGDVIVTAVLPEGYKLIESEELEKAFELDEDTDGKVIQFVVQLSANEEPTEGADVIVPDPEDEEADLEGGETVEEEVLEETPSEVIPDGDSENPNTEIEVPSEESDIVDTDQEDAEEVIDNTIGEETAYVRSLMVASLDDLYLTYSPNVANVHAYASNEDHGEYLYKTLFALASVKAYLLNPTEEYKSEVIAYITPNIHDGAFKKLLLDYLNYDIFDIGDDGEPDLTPVYPTPPPPKPDIPTPKPDIDEPTKEPTEEIEKPSEKPNPWIPTPPANVDKPSIEIPAIPGGETEAVTEKINVTTDDDGYKWTIENPTESTYTLTAEGIEIVVPLEFDAAKWEIQWNHIKNEHYKLTVMADGKVVSQFKNPIKVKKTHGQAYLLRSQNGEYSAMPYNYNSGKFNFDTKRTGEFYFSTVRVTFNDVQKVYSKDEIEELASRHIVYGTNTNKYSPNAKLTRAQFAAMLSRSLGLEATGENPFKDTKGKWFEKEVQALYEAGIISGTSATTFNPNAYITRQQAASMLEKVLPYPEAHVNYANLGGLSTISNKTVASTNFVASTFDDSYQISDYAKNAVGVLQTLGIISGKEDNKFDPQGYLTRAQMAKILTGTLSFTDKF